MFIRKYAVEIYSIIAAALLFGCLVGTVTAIRNMEQASSMLLLALVCATGFGIMAVAAAEVRARQLQREVQRPQQRHLASKDAS